MADNEATAPVAMSKPEYKHMPRRIKGSCLSFSMTFMCTVLQFCAFVFVQEIKGLLLTLPEVLALVSPNIRHVTLGDPICVVILVFPFPII